MKKIVYTLALIMSIQAQAQVVYDYPVKKSNIKKVVEVQADESAASNQTNPIYIVNSQNQRVQSAQASVQEQPITVVESSSLRESRADALRKSRQNLEVQTEQRIVEKLEEARMEEERARQERMFGAGSGLSSVGAANATQAQPVAPAPVQQAAPVQPQVIVVQQAAPEKAEAELVAEESASQKKALDTKNEYYMSGIVGTSSYHSVSNVRGNMASGFALGLISPERFVFEGSFIYSSYEIEVIPGTPIDIRDLNQYNFGLAAKYQVFPGMFRPTLGVLGTYTYRTYSSSNYSLQQTQDVSSNAFDVGALLGADINFTEKFGMGIEGRYMRNLSSRNNNRYQWQYLNPVQGKPIEELNYYMVLVSAKFLF